ncbi:hypothetical protein [Enterobacter asburiae]|uniref:hypothetical protein n=1 Tax=Enterobacter asburiae TaxID=61645 RepID=UPI003F5525E4
MLDSYDIAKRITDIVLSPNTIDQFISGSLSVPRDLAYMVYGIFDTDSRFENEIETERIIRFIKSGNLDYHHVLEAVNIIFDEFNIYVSETKQDSIYRDVSFSIIGRLLTNSFITAQITSSVMAELSLIPRISGRLAIGSLFLVSGMIEHSILASQELQRDNPRIYSILRSRDYDLLYFLFKPAIQPFVDAITIRTTQGKAAFEKIIEIMEDRLNG